jgi:hypothetical protein
VTMKYFVLPKKGRHVPVDVLTFNCCKRECVPLISWYTDVCYLDKLVLMV